MNKYVIKLQNKKRKEIEEYEISITDEELTKFLNDAQEVLVGRTKFQPVSSGTYTPIACNTFTEIDEYPIIEPLNPCLERLHPMDKGKTYVR